MIKGVQRVFLFFSYIFVFYLFAALCAIPFSGSHSYWRACAHNEQKTKKKRKCFLFEWRDEHKKGRNLGLRAPELPFFSIDIFSKIPFVRNRLGEVLIPTLLNISQNFLRFSSVPFSVFSFYQFFEILTIYNNKYHFQKIFSTLKDSEWRSIHSILILIMDMWSLLCCKYLKKICLVFVPLCRRTNDDYYYWTKRKTCFYQMIFSIESMAPPTIYHASCSSIYMHSHKFGKFTKCLISWLSIVYS